MTFMFQMVAFLHFYPYITSFIAGFMGEEFLLVLAFLAGQKIVPFWVVFGFGFLGVLVIDSLYYLIGKMGLFHNYVWRKIKKSRYKNIVKILDKITHHNRFLALFLTKFVYGPRMIVSMQLASSNMGYKKYLLYEIGAVLLWSAIMLPLAWISGKGIIASFSAVKNLEKVIGLAILFTLGIYIIERLFLSKLLKRKV